MKNKAQARKSKTDHRKRKRCVSQAWDDDEFNEPARKPQVTTQSDDDFDDDERDEGDVDEDDRDADTSGAHDRDEDGSSDDSEEEENTDDEDSDSDGEDVTPTSDDEIRTDADRFADYVQRLKARRAHRASNQPGITTGITQLDTTLGGLRGKVLLAGEAGAGKTSLALQLCMAALKAHPDLGVVYHAFDDVTVDEIWDQLLCNAARVDHAQFLASTRTQEENARLLEAAKWLSATVHRRMRTYTFEDSDGTRGADEPTLFKRCQQLREASRVDRVLLVIDLLQNMPVKTVIEYGDPEEVEEVRRIATDPDRWRLHQIEYWRRYTRSDKYPEGWPVLIVCEVRKPEGKRRELTSADLLGSVHLQYTGTQILFLMPEPTADPGAPVPTTLKIAKARYGKMTSIPLRFHYGQFRFEEVNPASAAHPPKRGPGRAKKTAAGGNGGDGPELDPLAGMES